MRLRGGRLSHSLKPRATHLLRMEAGARLYAAPGWRAPPALEHAMKYLLLVYHELAVWANLDPEERDALEQACLAGEQELNARGHLSAVQDVSTSGPPVVVRAGAGAPAVAEGSCAAPGLALAQLCLIDARDFNEAIRLAAWLPHARRGPIEVCALPEPEP